MNVSDVKSEASPKLFINLPVTSKTRGVLKPSPTAPMKPRVINHKSTASACMNMDLIGAFTFMTAPVFSFSL